MKHLIVARLSEDDSWTQRVPEHWNVLLVQKGRDLDNAGREGSSFHWGLERLYPELHPEDVVACVQGWPFDHCPSLFRELERAMVFPFRWLGGPPLHSDEQGLPHDIGLDVRGCYERWTGREWPGSVTFAAGGQFMVEGGSVLFKPREQYASMIEDVARGRNAWAMERLWREFFREAEL